MLHGRLITLRGRLSDDVPVLHAQLHEDIANHLFGSITPWRPVGLESEQSPYAIKELSDDATPFSVVETATGELAGAAILWGIDMHNRSAHIGLTLFQGARGRGLGADVVAVLCDYAFRLLGLHRVQLETSLDNIPMQRTAVKLGFTREGVQRQATWVAGRFTDDVFFGLLADEWTPPGDN